MSRNISLVLASTLIVSITTPVAAFGAFNQSCDILSWNPSYPGQITPGGAVQVVSTIDIACAQWRTFYSARLDLVDRTSGRILSTGTFQIGWLPNVTKTVSNNATAPMSVGEWKLQLNLYIFEEASLVTTFKNAFSISVADPVAPAQQQAENATTSTARSQLTTTQMAQPLQTNSIPATASTSSLSYIEVALALVALIGVSVLLVAKRLRSSGAESKPPDVVKRSDE